jgi:hypothetical protein
MASDYIGAVRVAVVGDNTQLDKSLKDSKKKTEDFGKSTAKLGGTLSKLFAGIGFAVVAKKLFDLGKQAENLFRVQELAETKLDATLKATGFAAGLTAEQLKTMASELQNVTTFGDETIISAQSMLLTFKDIGEDVFPRALESILDVSSAMGTDLQSSTIQIGKALNDPIAGLAALSRVGIQFTEDQKDLIKGFVESGDKAQAQAVILKELESQFGGVAKAAALTSDGISKQLNNSYGDLLETIGSVISEAMTPYRQNLQQEIDKVNDSIKAHILRKKAIAGDATLIEELTLKQIEQQKAEDRLAQAKLNIKNAEEQVLDTQFLSEVQINQIVKAREAAIKQAENTIIALEDEVALRKIGTQEAQAALDAENKLLETNIELAQGIQTVTDNTEDNTEATGENTDALDEQLEREEAFLEIYNEKSQAEYDYRQALEDRAERQKELDEEEIARAEEIAQAKIDLAFEVSNASIGFLDSLSGFQDAQNQAELARLEANGASEEELAKKKKQFAIEAAKRKKATGTLSAVVDTASAIIGYLADPGGIPGIVLSAIAGATGALQIGAIAATPLPSFATGGIVPGTPSKIDNTIANVASGELIANQDQKDRMLMEFLNGGGGGGQTRVIVNLNKKVLIDTIAQASKNGTIVIDSRSVKA